jgi:glycosyltransferase involved in cell wall biosynthesis
LAAGLPVIVQDTGFSHLIPNGEGLMVFNSLESAAAAFRAVESDYRAHQRAARRLAESHFSPAVVLGEILSRIGVC